METILDSKYVVYTVIGLVPNLLLILWAMARLSRDVRILYAKLSLLEGDMRVVDQGLNSVSEQARRATKAMERAGKLEPGSPAKIGSPDGSGEAGGSW